ncbi:hypothetical protein GLOIN_2v403882 [Rhizophagus irregularis DAOM 181602=DAOM 197198]|uniref:Uncharacterized protein n=1 Tax=Rhizophagus irregularis (strain DAOM 181602 / DAOM 197198 / MUCL 43194) TaxID=747089 RepID=A0A2P4PKG5_RHIID|nr:hypothetical protein GLOIN_2v403882 [Rhizophagus irregularis DAOM 181602=DAOM 197198]POG65874.1 hypothetical protein GLOIN_2v403882 [Rhizophagus irregularis DAOM 181602=DAOM 197198]|eukprot:XP_025172740.1 hypothetical protein GLOIN_2v403882 [Rhizophagus irregularis DAOM 181602=DAOM 197198]
MIYRLIYLFLYKIIEHNLFVLYNFIFNMMQELCKQTNNENVFNVFYQFVGKEGKIFFIHTKNI